MAKPKSKSKPTSKSKKPAASAKAKPAKAAAKTPAKAAAKTPANAAPKTPAKAAAKKPAATASAKKPAAAKKSAAAKKPTATKSAATSSANPARATARGAKTAGAMKAAVTKAASTKASAKKPVAAKKPVVAQPTESTISVTESASGKTGLVRKLIDKMKAVVGKRPPPPASKTPVGLSPELKARIQAAMPEGSFAEHLRNLSVHADTWGAWTHADMPELVGLERWGRELAAKDREAGIAALVEAARFGFPRAAESGREELVDVGFFADHPSVDGAPVETQIEVSAAWLDNPDHLDAVSNAFDESRQLNVWDDDLRPEDGRAYWWYTEVGQCCCAAIIRDNGTADGATYYEWDPATIVGRGLVMAVRGVRQEETNIDEILDEMRDAMLA